MLKKIKQKRFPVLPGIFFFIIVLCMLYNGIYWENNSKTETCEDFTDRNLLRFHIRAQSNSREDQETKMAVRQKVLTYLKENLDSASDKSQVRSFVLAHRTQLGTIISSELKKEEQNKNISIYFTKEFFPMRKYGQTIVPAGMYEALRIDLGEAKGKNWWCVLYPGLCLIDAGHVMENPEEKEQLDQMLESGSVKIRYQSYFKKFFRKKGISF